MSLVNNRPQNALSFATFSAAAENVNGKSVMRLDGLGGTSVVSNAWIRLGKRSDGFKSNNMAVRQALIKSLLSEAGVTKVEELPTYLKTALNIGDFGLDEAGRVTSEKPLTARRIRIIANEVETLREDRALLEKLGVPIDYKAASSLLKLMRGGAVFNLPTHTADCERLLACLRSGDMKNASSEIKDTLEQLMRLPSEKRLDALTTVLAGGVSGAGGLMSEKTLAELRAIQPEGMLTAKTLQDWAQGKIREFGQKFPFAPDLARKGPKTKKALGPDLLSNAIALDTLITLEGKGRLGLIKEVNLSAWKNGPQKAQGFVTESLGDSADLVYLQSCSRGFDLGRLLLEMGDAFADRGLTLRSLPKNFQPMNGAFLADVGEQIRTDLPRTHITAKFVSTDGSARLIDTGDRPSGEQARQMAGTIRSEVNRFMGLAADAPETPQTKMVLAMFSQLSMIPIATATLGCNADIEHSPRELTVRRDGPDVIVRAKSSDPNRSPAFDFTVRIRPDGSNSYHHLDVRTTAESARLNDLRERLAHGIVMSILNTDTPEIVVDTWEKATYASLMANVRKMIADDPGFVDLMGGIVRPTAEQLKAFDAFSTAQLKTDIAADFKKGTAVKGFAEEGHRCLMTKALMTCSINGKIAQQKDSLDRTERNAVLDQIRNLIPAEPRERHDKILFALSYCLGLHGPVCMVKFHPEPLGLPSQDMLLGREGTNPDVAIKCIDRIGDLHPRQDISIKGNELVLSQQVTFMPHGFVLPKTAGAFNMYDHGGMVAPTVSFVSEIRIPLDQQIPEGGMPDFTMTTRIAE